MKISIAMALGRTMIFPIAGTHLNHGKTGGCAWGMVEVAAPSSFGGAWRRAIYFRTLPPCGCTGAVLGNGMCVVKIDHICDLGHMIVHLFNDHVMTKKDWTLDQLIDWVASVEPPDPEEEVIRKEIHEEILACREHVEHR